MLTSIDQPVLGERQPVHVRPDGRAGQAVGAVAAQHIAGLHTLLAAAHPIQEAHPHPTVLGSGLTEVTSTLPWMVTLG